MLDSTSKLIGQPELKSRLADTLVKGYPIYHAYLFSAEKGMGKTSFALEFAKQILCLKNKNTENNLACNKCDACRFFDAQTSPDFKHIQKGKENIIKIDRIRKEIIADIPMRPQISEKKIYLLNLDDLNEQGQNALLKSLEEPPEHVVFLLTTALIENILDTIVSRVITLNFQRYSPKEIEQILEQKIRPIDGKTIAYEQELDFIISYAAGNPGTALQIAQDQDFKENRKQAIDWFFKLPTSNRTILLTEYLDYFNKNKDQIDLFYRIWQDLIHDLLLLLEDNSVQKVIQIDILERSKKLADYYRQNENLEQRKNKLLNAYSAISEAKRASQVNASFEGMIGQLLLTLRKDLHI